jgi:DNA-binding NarL/FixJ family response regulator
MAATTKRLIIIDDHPLFREGIKTILKRDDRYVPIEAGGVAEARAAFANDPPDVALMDVSLPDGDGLTLTAELIEEYPDLIVVVLSMHARREKVVGAFRAGASGYVVKESAAEELIAALDAALKGERYYNGILSDKAYRDFVEPSGKPEGRDRLLESLTDREREVMKRLVLGETAREIAEKLFISPKTVDNHRASIVRKMRVKNVVELAHFVGKEELL